ncbi:MAG: hypothetical protein OFPI_25530 [Osedax symbiont Rs2]|nr:MAG: hypothetical protein OFPI_25530 [Osedax symbiont Rs2]
MVYLHLAHNKYSTQIKALLYLGNSSEQSKITSKAQPRLK